MTEPSLRVPPPLSPPLVSKGGLEPLHSKSEGVKPGTDVPGLVRMTVGHYARAMQYRFIDPKPIWYGKERKCRNSPESQLPKGSAYRIGNTRAGTQFIDSMYWSTVIMKDLLDFSFSHVLTRRAVSKVRSEAYRFLRIAKVDGVATGLLKTVQRLCSILLRKTTHRSNPKAQRAIGRPVEAFGPHLTECNNVPTLLSPETGPKAGSHPSAFTAKPKRGVI